VHSGVCAAAETCIEDCQPPVSKWDYGVAAVAIIVTGFILWLKSQTQIPVSTPAAHSAPRHIIFLCARIGERVVAGR
jgi:hypothetical protein